MVFFWGNCSTSSFLSFFSPTVWVIPCRKWVRRWDCTLEWLPPRLKCLPSTHLHLNSPAVTYYRMRQMDSRDEEREKRLKAFSFLSKSARCQVRMERCRNCRHSDLNYNSRISATSGMEADMILFCVTFFFFFLFSFIQAAAANVPLRLWVQFPGGLSLHIYYPLCPWAGHYLCSPSGGIWLCVNGSVTCTED